MIVQTLLLLMYKPKIIFQNNKFLDNIKATTVYKKTNVLKPQPCGFSQNQVTSAQLQSRTKHES